MAIQDNLSKATHWFGGPLTVAGRVALCVLIAHLSAQDLVNPVSTGVAATLAKKSWLPVRSSPALRSLFEMQDVAQPAAAGSSSLSVSVVEGEGAVNTIGQGTSHQVVVRVQDAKGAPVEDAVVTFLLPADGPSGTFPNGTRNLSVTTDDLGHAIMGGFEPNSLAGALEIRVTVSIRGEVAHAIVHQSNSVTAPVVPATAGGGGTSSAASKKKSSTTLILLIVGGAAAAGAAAAFAGKGGGSSSSTTPPVTPVSVGISVGSGSFGSH